MALRRFKWKIETIRDMVNVHLNPSSAGWVNFTGSWSCRNDGGRRRLVRACTHLTLTGSALMPADGVRCHRLRTAPDADPGAISTLPARIGEDALRLPTLHGPGMIRGASFDYPRPR
jgi:hypothetical protein